jgi:hypothetical protein
MIICILEKQVMDTLPIEKKELFIRNLLSD